jgi:hypothetical protein
MRVLKLFPDNTNRGIRENRRRYSYKSLRDLISLLASQSLHHHSSQQRHYPYLHYFFADIRQPNTVQLYGRDPIRHRSPKLLFHLRCGSIVAVASADHRAGRERRAPGGATGRIEVK